jgi:hypothetical protein
LAAGNTSIPNSNWQLMLETMATVMTIIAEYFPDTPILPAIGNNDCYYHDLAPSAEYALDYYTDL